MNIYDIAREAGVSITTVSRVINHREQVNAVTRERVEKVLKAHNYKPNATARNLVTKSSSVNERYSGTALCKNGIYD